MKKRSALFFDIDGTLLSEKTKEIPASTVRALQKAKQEGHAVFINTGRTLCSVPVKIKRLAFDGLLCGCGTYIVYQMRSFSNIRFQKTTAMNISTV